MTVARAQKTSMITHAIHSFAIILFLSNFSQTSPCKLLPPGTFVDKVTHFLCATSRSRFTSVETRAQQARRAPLAHPPQGNMDQGQAAPLPQQAAPPAQPAAAVNHWYFWLHRRHLWPHRLLQLSPWDRGAHTPSSTLMTPIPAQWPPSYTTKPSLLSRPSSMESGQPGSLPGQRARSGTALQLAPAHHSAYRRRHHTEPAHPLWTGLSGQHQGTRGYICKHADQGRSR